MILPSPCTTCPEFCNNGPFGRHFTAKGHDKCENRHESVIGDGSHYCTHINNQDADGTQDDNALNDLSRNSDNGLEFMIAGGREKKLEAARAGRISIVPATQSSLVLTNTAERQLLLLGSVELQILNMLIDRGIYLTNSKLRRGQGIDGPIGHIDDNGYLSVRMFADAASEVFTSLGSELELNDQLTVYRGMGIPKNPNANNPDIAGMRAHMDNGTPLPKYFIDDGFSFATTDPYGALKYKGKDLDRQLKVDTVLLVLDVVRGICIPHKDHQSGALMAHTYRHGPLETTREQIIFPRHTEWSINSFKWSDQYGVYVVHMRQI